MREICKTLSENLKGKDHAVDIKPMPKWTLNIATNSQYRVITAKFTCYPNKEFLCGGVFNYDIHSDHRNLGVKKENGKERRRKLHKKNVHHFYFLLPG